MNRFTARLEYIQKKNNSLVCVGLDPDLEKIPHHLRRCQDPVFTFSREIIEATHDLVCAYKPNIAFYEAEGEKGLRSLKKTINYLRQNHPQIPLILDAKRADIGNTSAQYAKAIFDYWQVDATTVYPFLGYDSVRPFLAYQDKYIFFLIRTSNPDAKMFQDIKVKNQPYYLYLAKQVKKWPGQNVGVFCGATYPQELKQIRSLFPQRPILTAGIGVQGGQAKLAVQAGVNKKGLNLICNASRSIIYASQGKDFCQAARKAANNLKEEINKYR
jgi:orotidine-5'-phosphate decarboxylase